MRGGRVLLIVGVVLFIGALAVGAYLLFFKPSPAPPPVVIEGETAATPMPESMTQIVVAAQNIPRGMRITEDDNAVIVQNWPVDAVPAGAIDDLEAVYGLITRVDIVLGMPILENMLTETAGDVGEAGSDAALQIPADKVAYALPVSRYSSMAWALQPGDHVDVILTLLVIDLDEEFQSVLPNTANCVGMTLAEGEECQSGTIGRLEALPTGMVVNVVPNETQRPRLVTQLTVQDAVVLQVGDWTTAKEPPPEEVPPETGAEGEAAPPPPPPPDRVEPLTLVVTRQDAMVLDYARVVGARINFVLRPVGDTASVRTDSVTLKYMMDRFDVELPPKLPYGVTPPVSQLERIARSESAAQYGATQVQHQEPAE